jgi:hypothetical protein
MAPIGKIVGQVICRFKGHYSLPFIIIELANRHKPGQWATAADCAVHKCRRHKTSADQFFVPGLTEVIIHLPQIGGL